MMAFHGYEAVDHVLLEDSFADEESEQLLKGSDKRGDQYVDMGLFLEDEASSLSSSCLPHLRLARFWRRRSKYRDNWKELDNHSPDTTALLSDDEHSLMHSTRQNQREEADDNKKHQDISLVWPETVSLAASQLTSGTTQGRKKRTLLQQWKSRMHRTFHKSSSSSSETRDDESHPGATTSEVGLYVYFSSDEVETIYGPRDGRFQAKTLDDLYLPSLPEIEERDERNEDARKESALVGLSPVRKRSFVVSYDEWDCAQMVLQTDPTESEEEDPLASLDPPGHGFEVAYNAEGLRQKIENDDEDTTFQFLDSSSDQEDVFLHPPPDRREKPTYVLSEYTLPDGDGCHPVFHLSDTSPTARDDVSGPEDAPQYLHPSYVSRRESFPAVRSFLSSTSRDDIVAHEEAALGAKYSHPNYSEPAIQESFSEEQGAAGLGIACAPPSWIMAKTRGSTLEQVAQVWNQIQSADLDGNVTDPPSPTKVERSKVLGDWTCGLGWSASSDSSLTVSDVGFTNHHKCVYGGGASTNLLSRASCGGATDFPYDEVVENESMEFDSAGCNVTGTVQDFLRTSLQHQEEEEEQIESRDRPICNCIKCSVSSMYKSLGM